MVIRTELGKITSAKYGLGGCQGAQFGLSVSLGGEAWGVSDFWGFWADPPSPHAKWSEHEQMDEYAQVAGRVRDLVKSAKVQHVGQLVGKPVQVMFEGQLLVSWRILTEVL